MNPQDPNIHERILGRNSETTIEGTFSFEAPNEETRVTGSFTAEEVDDLKSLVCVPERDEGGEDRIPEESGEVGSTCLAFLL